ncbi:thioredoxin family protein [Trichothermofontia sichuanensis B231]|uniref:thioredoxin family protein n=1 Tax=Trichothermofontia sichuanensis TaxID=3045816 RepID=UPI0022457CD7|nr:thioredoxin family protein [Trichothermofontia sichuanensis]UZQ55814.1 thioredoxin family protein [Trichothermofontia sichuanensis B231]
MTSPPNSQPTVTTSPTLITRLRNLVIVGMAILLSVALFLGLRIQTQTPSLPSLAAASTPLNVALTNQQPTLIEFYADWCTSCQAMARDIQALKAEYGDRVNFVMLNVDNSKWLPEVLHYRVDGIPHFVFLDRQGQAIASSIGEQPRPILAANLEALIAGEPLPYSQVLGRTSEFDATIRPDGENTANPQSHGAQVRG